MEGHCSSIKSNIVGGGQLVRFSQKGLLQASSQSNMRCPWRRYLRDMEILLLLSYLSYTSWPMTSQLCKEVGHSYSHIR